MFCQPVKGIEGLWARPLFHHSGRTDTGGYRR